MRIAIDARMINFSNMHGIARYTYNLLIDLPANEHTIFALVNPKQNLDLSHASNTIHPIEVKSKWIGIKEQFELPWLLWQNKIDLFHSPSFVAPIFCPCKLILTIHDLNHLFLRENYSFFHQLYYRFIVTPKIKAARYLLTVSQFSKEQIVARFKKNPADIIVTANGVAPKFFEESKIDSFFNLPKEFLFCLGGEKKHKNTVPFLKAYLESSVTLPLYLATSETPELTAILNKQTKANKVIFLGKVNDKELQKLFQLCTLFIFPSTFEGFGIPVLEAFASGAAVLTSNVSSIPEIGAGYAIYMNPHSIKDMQRNLEAALNLANIHDPKARMKRVNYAKTFTFKKMAKSTLCIYNKILGTPR